MRSDTQTKLARPIRKFHRDDVTVASCRVGIERPGRGKGNPLTCCRLCSETGGNAGKKGLQVRLLCADVRSWKERRIFLKSLVER